MPLAHKHTFKPGWATLALGAALVAGAGAAHAAPVIVTGFATSPSAGVWGNYDMQGGATTSVVYSSGLGGNATQTNGAALLTTGLNNPDRAQVYVGGNYGTASDILSGISLSYDYYRTNIAGGNTFAAPALKLTFASAAGSVTLIYEPYWNEASGSPTPGQWNSVSIDFTHGLFWENGGFGQASGAGGPPLGTLQYWLSAFNSDFASASLVGVGMGIGTYNQGQVDYFDNVHIAAGRTDVTYDFQIAATDVPEPATLALAAAGLVGLGVSRKRRNKKA